MKLNQLSVFFENRPGGLTVPCRVLADAGINILTISLADTQQFGILRLIVRDWQKARDVLQQSGCAVNVTEVVALGVADRPGGLAEVLGIIEKVQTNLEYMYAFTFRSKGSAILVFRFEKPDQAIAALGRAGVKPISAENLFDLAEEAQRGAGGDF